MINGFLTRKILALSLMLACFVGEAVARTDSVVMTVAGKPVLLDEFVFMLQKNGVTDMSDR